MTQGYSGSYAVNGSNFTLQPSEGRWEPKDPIVFNAIEKYHLFSKLEHNGELTFFTHHLAIDSLDKALDEIYLSLDIILKTINIVAKALFRNINGANKEIDESIVNLYLED